MMLARLCQQFLRINGELLFKLRVETPLPYLAEHGHAAPPRLRPPDEPDSKETDQLQHRPLPLQVLRRAPGMPEPGKHRAAHLVECGDQDLVLFPRVGHLLQTDRNPLL